MDVLGEAWVKISPQLDSFEGEVESKVGAAAGAAGDSGAKILTERLTPAAAVIAAATGAIAESYNAAKASIVEATGASGAALEKLLGITRSVATSGVSTSLGEIGEVVGLISQRLKGLSSQQTEDLTRSIVKLAEITGGDASDSVAQITDLFEKWNVPAAEQVGLLDRLFAASQRAGVSMDTFVTLLATNAGPLQRFGFSLEQTAAVITQIEQAGGDAAPVLAAMNTAFAKMASLGLEPVSAFAALSDSIRSAKTNAEAMQIGIEGLGSRAARVLVPAIRNGTLSAQEFSNALDKGAGSIDRTHEATRSLGDRFKEFRNSVGAVIAPVAQYAAIIGTVAAGSGPLAQGIIAAVAPLRQVQAAAALSGQSMSLGAAAASKYGGALKTAALAGGAFAAGLAVQEGLGRLSDMFFEAARGADTFENRAQSLAGTFSSLASEGLVGGLKQAAEMDKAVQSTVDSMNDLSVAYRDGAISSAEFRSGMAEFGEIGVANEIIREHGAAAAAARVSVEGLGVGVSEAGQMVQDSVSEFEAANGSLGAHRQATIDSLVAQGQFAAALSLVAQWQATATSSSHDLTAAFRDLTDEARAARLAQLELAGGLVGITSSVISLRDAQRTLGEAEGRVARLQARGRQGTAAFAQALRDQEAAALQVLTGQNSLTSSVLEFIDAQVEAGKSTKEVVADVRAQGREAGLTGGEIRGLIGITRDAIRSNKDFGVSARSASGVARAAFNAVKGAMGPVGNAIGAAGQSGGSRFAGASRAGAGAARSAYAGIPGALSFLPGAFGAIGANAASAFAAGLSGMISRAAAIAGAAVAAARNAMQIGSPSRAFMNLGYESRRGYMLEFDKLPDEVSRTVDRALHNLRSGGAAPQHLGTGGPGAAATHVGTADLEQAFERVAAKMGGLSPVIVQGGVLDLTEATGLADQARRRRAVLLGGRRFS